jgi:hypothetical protein
MQLLAIETPQELACLDKLFKSEPYFKTSIKWSISNKIKFQPHPMAMGLVAIGGQVEVTNSTRVNFLGALRHAWQM